MPSVSSHHSFNKCKTKASPRPFESLLTLGSNICWPISNHESRPIILHKQGRELYSRLKLDGDGACSTSPFRLPIETLLLKSDCPILDAASAISRTWPNSVPAVSGFATEQTNRQTV